MSDDIKRSDRRARTANAIARQKRIAKSAGVNHSKDQSHRYAKMHALNCGDSSCVMCGNPRKFFNEPTMQEKISMEKFKEDTKNI